MSAATPERILQAVEDQHSRLINVVSTVRCLKSSVEPASELGGALELVEHELQRILDALEGPALDEAARD